MNKKKTILFFSRSELTYLYGSIDKHLKDSFTIIHVAYSIEEELILREKYQIENITVFKEVAKDFLNEQITDEKLKAIDQLLIEQTDGGFNLNSALQSNRTSLYLEYKDSLQITLMYYETWKKIFGERRINFFVHEPVSLLMNQIAAAICKKQGGIYTAQISVSGENPKDFNYIMLDHYNGSAVSLRENYYNLTSQAISDSRDRISRFLQEFRSNYEIFFNSLGTGALTPKLYLNAVDTVVRQKIINTVKPRKMHPLLDNVEVFLKKDDFSGRRLRNLTSYVGLQYDTPEATDTYYFYPLHLEPEAVVLYWADGYYTNQVKLIENIAAQLPPGHLLYVKDHPHLYGYREVADYKRIQNIPNAKLLPPHLPGKQIIKNCKGVITINGTAGFEALLMGKQVIAFGSSFYSVAERVILIKNIKDLRDKLYEIQDTIYEDDETFYRFILAYLLSLNSGFVNFFIDLHQKLKIDVDENAKAISEGLKKHFNNHTTDAINSDENTHPI
jgi:hypothetical protein